MKTQVWVMRVALGAAVMAAVAGCHRNSVSAQENGNDPAAANLAQQGAGNEAQQQAAQYNGQQAPIERAYPNAQQGAPPPGYYDNGQQPYGADQGYGQGDEYAPVDYDSLTDEQATEPPPPLPDYDQPPAPDPDYLWTPGYWGWGPYGYYWVPGAWVEAPYVGALWTPGYWGYVGNAYRFHHGYWGRHVGFYGGINYGFGYIGFGYEGGYWNGGHFFYNTAVTHVNVNVVRNVYAHNVVENRGPRVSFVGGRGGLQVRPRPAELAAIREQRYAPTQSQEQLRQQSSQNRQQSYSANHGRPAETVAARPVTSDHRMPAEMPRAAAMPGRTGAQGLGNRPSDAARQPQQGVQPGRPDNVPRGGAASEITRPGQGQQQRGQDARPVQPQTQQAAPQQSAPQQQQRQLQQQQMRQQPQAQPRPQVQQRPDFQRGQGGRPAQPQSQQAAPQQVAPQQQRQLQQQQMRQQPQAQPRPQPQAQQRAAPQPHPGGSPPQAHAQPQPQHQGPPPQAHDNGHGSDHKDDKQ